MGDHIKTSGFFFLHGIQNLLYHIQIQLVDQPRVLQRRNKVGWGQKAFFRIDPSCQHFHIANPFIDGADDRLHIHLNPFFLDRPVNILDDVLPFHSVVTQILTVIVYSRFISAA